MPHEGDFIGKNDVVYNYTVVSWRHIDDDIKNDDPDKIDSTAEVGEVTLEIENDETGKIDYQTIVGPFDDWDYVDNILEIDWGPNGTR